MMVNASPEPHAPASDGPATRGRRLLLALRQIGPLRLAATVALVVAAVIFARFSVSIPLIGGVENALYDLRALAAAPVADQDPRITLVVYNDATLAKLRTRSPLDRDLLARALTQIDALGPKAIGVDILIDKSQPEDAALVAALRGLRTPTSLAFATNATNPQLIQPDQEATLRAFQARLAGSKVVPASVLVEPDADGVIRSWPPQPATLPPPLAMRMAPDHPQFTAYKGAIEFRRQRLSDYPLYRAIPIELLSQPGLATAFRPLIAGKYVLIGAQLSDTDLTTTPSTLITQVHPSGLELHADLLAQVLDGRRATPIPGWLLWGVALTAVFGGLMTSALQMRLGAALLLAIQAVALVAVPSLLQSRGLDTQTVPQFGWAAGWMLAYTAFAAAARSVGAEQRRYAQSALGKYLPRDVAAEILRDPNQLKLQGERREIYALFTDLQGFTAMSHGLEPEPVAAVLNHYLQTLSAIVLDYGGTIDKFVGDSVVAFWGAPIARPGDGERAAQAAVALWRAGDRLRLSQQSGGPKLGTTRIGLHRGVVLVGNFGGEGRFQYTAFGDAMNTAARLEAANKQLETRVLVSLDAAPATMADQFRAMGRVSLRGRSTPIEVFEAAADFPAEACVRLNAAYARFDAGDLTGLDVIRGLADAFAGDRALQNLAARLAAKGPGGSFNVD